MLDRVAQSLFVKPPYTNGATSVDLWRDRLTGQVVATRGTLATGPLAGPAEIIAALGGHAEFNRPAAPIYADSALWRWVGPATAAAMVGPDGGEFADAEGLPS